MTNRTAPTHTALITYDPMRQLDTVLILDLATGRAVDRLVVGDAEWVGSGAQHLNRRGFEPVNTTQGTGVSHVDTWPLVRIV